MFQYATGIAYSRITQREIEFRTTHGINCRLGEFVGPNRYPLIQEINQQNFFSPLLHNKMNTLLGKLRLQSIYQEKSLNFSNIFESKADRFHGYFQSWRYFDHMKHEIIADFTLKDSLSFHYPLPKSFTAVHIRRGGPGSAVLSSEYHGLLSEDYYRAALKLNEKLGGSADYIVFTDNPKKASQIIDKLDSKPIEVIGPDDVKSQVQNLILMASATSFIGANSSYSWWAAYLSTNLKTPPIFPRQWYMNPDISNNDMLPPDWITVGFGKFLNERTQRGTNGI